MHFGGIIIYTRFGMIIVSHSTIFYCKSDNIDESSSKVIHNTNIMSVKQQEIMHNITFSKYHGK
jgi:hypothetical protein